MATIIYPSPIFGPVVSRRLGISLGINLMPGDGKMCSFDCIYCECGLNINNRTRTRRPTRRAVSLALEEKLREMVAQGTLPDVLTFAGNGEPTAHPQFNLIIDDTIELRNRYCPNARISVLSNATFIGHKRVRDALMKVDNNILKLDTVDKEYIRRVDRPASPLYNVKLIIENMKKFHGHVIIQTMFLHGLGTDNTASHYVDPWLDAIAEIAPQSVMIYTVDRETAIPGLRKATPDELNSIRDSVVQLGIPCTASY